MELDDAQRARMEQNRPAALARKAAMQQQQQEAYKGVLVEAFHREGCEIDAMGLQFDAEVVEDPYLVPDEVDEDRDDKTLWELLVKDNNVEMIKGKIIEIYRNFFRFSVIFWCRSKRL